jgi:uncharacterized RmlC-like cupin family protein
MDASIEVVGKPRSAPAQATPGMDRQEAFADDHVWVGRVHTEPMQWSGWHTHPGHDTFVYGIRGRTGLEFGPGGREVAELGPGEFARIPKGLVHREGNVGDEPGEVIVFRVGEGPTVVNVDGPEGVDNERGS